ncbi:alpha/beta-hydrolase [Colletotrichum caudatum]|nr:alpha/beta-hydrolase [Colletotrichum caudatum]
MEVQPARVPQFKYKTANMNGVTYNYIHAEPKGEAVIAQDMIGTLKRDSDDIAILASHLGVLYIVIGGYDWGGAVIYCAALWHLELVAAFFVISMLYLPLRVTYINQALMLPIAWLPSGVSAFNLSGDGLALDLLDGVTKDMALLTTDKLDFYIDNYANNPFNNTLNWYRTSELNWRDELSLLPGDAASVEKFAQPALYIGGLQDSALPPVLSTGIEVYFDSLARGVANGSHWVMLEKPTEVNGFIGNWLAASVLGNVTAGGLNLTTSIGAAGALAMR